MTKPTTYILLCFSLLLIVISCTDADPLRPDGPMLEVDATDIVFDALFTFQSQTKKVAIRNTGDTELVISNVRIDDNLDGEYTFVLNSQVLAPGGVDTLSVSFSPSDFIRYDSDLVIESNFENDVLIRLDGTGIPKVSNQEIWNFTSQSGVNQFASEMFDVVNTEEVIISSTANINDPVLDLSSLSVIKEVERLQIINNSSLEDLTGLEGILVKSELIVKANDQLTSLNQLDGLVSSNFSIDLEDNRRLSSLDFLGGLTTIGTLRVVDNGSLTNFVGAESIETIDGDLVVLENDRLESLNGLEGISIAISDDNMDGEMRIIDDIRVEANPVLNDYCGLVNTLSQGEAFYGNVIITNNQLETTLLDLQTGICN